MTEQQLQTRIAHETSILTELEQSLRTADETLLIEELEASYRDTLHSLSALALYKTMEQLHTEDYHFELAIPPLETISHAEQPPHSTLDFTRVQQQPTLF